MFVPTTAVSIASIMSFGCVLYILGWSQPLHCSQKSIWITSHCLALHLRKQPHKHDNPIKDVYNWHRCITQHKEPNFVPVYSLCCMLYDKLLHTSIEDLLCRDSSMNWLYGEKKKKEKEYYFSFKFTAVICSEQDLSRETNYRSEREHSLPPFPSVVDNKSIPKVVDCTYRWCGRKRWWHSSEVRY